MKRVLIKCGWLVTLDPRIGEIKDGELLYRGNTIEAAGRNIGAAKRLYLVIQIDTAVTSASGTAERNAAIVMLGERCL